MIDNNTRFLGVDSSKVNLTEKKDSINNAVTQYYTAEQIGAAAGAKVAQVEITQDDILNPLGFLKLLVPSMVNKIKIPISLAIYRKSGGTNYTVPNSIRLNTIIGSNFTSLGNTADAAFIGSTEGSLVLNYASAIISNLSPNNNLSLVSGIASSPSTISGGTGDLIAYITYVEIDTN